MSTPRARDQASSEKHKFQGWVKSGYKMSLEHLIMSEMTEGLQNMWKHRKQLKRLPLSKSGRIWGSPPHKRIMSAVLDWKNILWQSSWWRLKQGLGWGSAVECLISMHETLSSIPSKAQKRKKYIEAGQHQHYLPNVGRSLVRSRIFISPCNHISRDCLLVGRGKNMNHNTEKVDGALTGYTRHYLTAS